MNALFVISLAILVVGSQSGVVKRQAKPCPDKCEDVPLDISFIVDGSASIWQSNFTEGLWFMERFVEKFNIGPDAVRVSMVSYGDRVYTEDAIHFDDYEDKKHLTEAIVEIPYQSGTRTETGMAIRWFLENQQPHAREGVRSVVIVLTDGNSQEPDVTKAAADEALEKGLEVFAIGVGHKVDSKELQNIASDFSHVMRVDSYKMLDDIEDRLAFEACGVAPAPECQYDPADIAFVIDSSRSIGEANFTLGLDFIKNLIDNFEVNPSALRVAAITYGNGTYDDDSIHFDEYKNKKDTVQAILDLPYHAGGQTDTALGVKYMVDHFLPNERRDAAHISIVITDGRSQRWQDTYDRSREARELGVTMFAVGVGRLGVELDEKELNEIAGDPSRVIVSDDYAKLGTIRDNLLDMTCSGIAQNRKTKAAAL